MGEVLRPVLGHPGRIRRGGSLVAALLVLLFAGACNGDGPSKDEPDAYTKHVVQQALDRYENDGRQATIDYYNSPASVDGEWYVFIADAEYVIVSHATQPGNVGQSLLGTLGIDSTDYAFGPRMAAATERGRWVSYVYLNPASGDEETKHAWVVRRDGLLFGSGWYEVTAGAGATLASKAQPDVYTKHLVRQALDRYEVDGHQATIDYYNSPESADGPWYVFILEDRDGDLYTIAHATRPELVGTTRDRIDADGFDYGKAFAAVTATGGGGWVSYLFTHPETGSDARKHSWVVRRGDLLFGSGWYE